MLAQAAADTPPVKDLRPGEVVTISACPHDLVGKRWFRVSAGDISGYVPAESLAPPKSTNPENGFMILRHSLMALDNPAVLDLATQAVDLYHASYPTSPHTDELQWLLAERTRQLSASSRSGGINDAARRIYEEIAKGQGEFSERAREVLREYHSPAPSTSARRPSTAPQESRWGASGGSTAANRRGYVDPSAPIRRVTVVSRTPLYVQITQPSKVTSGAVFHGVFARDVRVSKEVAVPQGSSAVVTVAQADSTKKVEDLLLTGATIRGESYMISGYSSEIDVPGFGRLSASKDLPSTLPAGTTIEFQLHSDLIVRQR